MSEINRRCGTCIWWNSKDEHNHAGVCRPNVHRNDVVNLPWWLAFELATDWDSGKSCDAWVMRRSG